MVPLLLIMYRNWFVTFFLMSFWGSSIWRSEKEIIVLSSFIYYLCCKAGDELLIVAPQAASTSILVLSNGYKTWLDKGCR